MKYLILFFGSFFLFFNTNNDLEKIEITDVRLRCSGLNWGEYVINNKEEFYNINCRRPKIDFSKYTLIVYKQPATGCYVHDIFYDIYKDLTSENDIKYKVKVQIIQYGYCRPLRVAWFWCLIPKIEEGAVVEFETELIIKPDDYIPLNRQ